MKIDLNGNDWRVGPAGAGRDLPAVVPGCIHKDLLRAGRIPDPQVRDNERLVQWVGETDWTYEREFEVPAGMWDHEHLELVCDGLDTLATIRLNGAELARTDNMHRRYRFDVARQLQAGTNRLEISFAAPLPFIRERQAALAMPHWPGDFRPPGFAWLRKAHSNFGWDWGQKLATCGIWRPIRLEAWSGARLGDVRVDQEHTGDGVTLTVRPAIAGTAAGCRVTLSMQGREVATAEGTGAAPVRLPVQSPRLWWPAGMGEQPLYTLRVELLGAGRAVLATREIRVGLRTLRLRRERDQWGESFTFEVNGRRFYAKGANWIPTDGYGSCQDEAYYRCLLQGAVDANMNMLRVWGGGIYEEDLFYDLCDELGLCVWQDFMFACAGYPLDDAEFVENVRLEAVDNVQRLQHHACLALWCGNNELELGWSKDWGLLGDHWQYGLLGKMPAALYSKVFDELLAEVVRTHGGQDYWPGSPHSPTGDRKDSNNPACGDAHLWDVLMEGKPFAFYATSDHRFVSEFGYQSLPSPRLLERVTEPADRNLTSRIMDWHQRMPVGSGIILRHLAQHLPLPGDFALTVWATQILHAILLETAIAHWRRNTPRTLGVLNWMLNDQWPGLTNATIDSAGAWKAPHYALRRLFAPLLVSGVVAPGGDAVDIHVSSDLQAPADVDLIWTLLRTDGAMLARGQVMATVPALSSRSVQRVDIGEFRHREGEENLLLWLDLASQGRVVSESVMTLVPPKHVNLLDPQLRVETRGATCRLTVQRPALWVWADAPVGQSWSDNFFHLRPGAVKEIALPARATATWHSLKDLGAETLSNTIEHRRLLMSIPYRQIHLDFHTSEAIPGIGAAWDKNHWQETLKRGHVNSINVFAVCHHGWSYYNTEVGQRHPGLAAGFDLTRAQLDACHEAGIHTQVYLTVGVNNRMAREHSQWRCISEQGGYYSWSTRPTDPGFHSLCFNTPYLEFVCDEVRELGRLFPDTDGLWLDIIHKPHCHCPCCMASMVNLGLDPKVEADVAKHADIVLQNYYRRTLAALREVQPTMLLTQNSGHLTRGDRRLLQHVTHLELESLPTGGWGYDDFPMSAKYAQLTGLEYLGMTGKFHTTWGEFGGFKHPNALRYECAAMLAYGAKCSVGDQLHPDGRLDDSTYAIIGEAYQEVEAKEPWCANSRNVADVGVLSAVALDPEHKAGADSDIGACRLLLEGHILFDILDAEMDVAPYKLLLLPDEAKISTALKWKLDAYLAAGGKILFTGRSPLDEQGKPLFDIGAEVAKESEFSLDYILPLPELRPEFVQSPLIIYSRYPRLQVTTGRSLGDVIEPYFERAWNHFCSHQHAPARREATGFACGVERGNLLWLPMDICRCYRKLGQVATKRFALACVRRLLGDRIGLRSNLPATARVTLTEQSREKRHVLHLLHANLSQRGSSQPAHAGGSGLIEVIEDLTPCCDVQVSLRLDKPVRRVTLEPQGTEIPFRMAAGRLELELDRFTCHQMVAVE